MNRIRSRSRGSRRDTTVSGADLMPPRRPGSENIPRAEVRRRRSINGQDSISLFDILQNRGGEYFAPAVRAGLQRSEEVQGMPMLIAGVESNDENGPEAVNFNQRDYDEILDRARPEPQRRRRNHVRSQQPIRQQPSRKQPTRGDGKRPAAATSSSPPQQDEEDEEDEEDEKDEAIEQADRPGRSADRVGKLPVIKKRGLKRKRSDSDDESVDADDEDEVTVEEAGRSSRSINRVGRLPAVNKRNKIAAKTVDGGKDELATEVKDKEGSEQSDEVAEEAGGSSRSAIRAGKLPIINKKRGMKRKRNITVKVEDEKETEVERSDTRPSREKEIENDSEHELDNARGREVLCFCRLRESGYMIQCDGCDEWFHDRCVGVTKERGKALAAVGADWYCCLCNPVPYHEPPPILPVTRREVWRAIPPEGITISELANMFFERIEKTQGPDNWRQTVIALIRQADEGECDGEPGAMRVIRREKRRRTTDDEPAPSIDTGSNNSDLQS